MIGIQGPLAYRWTSGSRNAQMMSASKDSVILFLWDDASENLKTKTGYPIYFGNEERFVGDAGWDIVAWLRGE